MSFFYARTPTPKPAPRNPHSQTQFTLRPDPLEEAPAIEWFEDAWQSRHDPQKQHEAWQDLIDYFIAMKQVADDNAA